MTNTSTEHLDTPEYACYSESWNRKHNQYATLKLIYSFDYGEKATRAPEYEHIVTESAIYDKPAEIRHVLLMVNLWLVM